MADPIVNLERYKIWDFIDVQGRNVILQWVAKSDLTKRDRATLNSKIKRLSQVEYSLAVSTKLLSGAIYKNIHKLLIHGDIMLRPLLCKGPIDNEVEYTLLLGAIEKGGKLPDGAKERADAHRTSVLANPKITRRSHERIP